MVEEVNPVEVNPVEVNPVEVNPVEVNPVDLTGMTDEQIDCMIEEAAKLDRAMNTYLPVSAEGFVWFHSNFKCQQCSPSCCEGKCTVEPENDGIVLNPGEPKEVAEAMSISSRKLREHCFSKDRNLLMHFPCPAFDKAKRCTIYSKRPFVCRQFPLLSIVSEIEGGKYLTAAPQCPGSREVLKLIARKIRDETKQR